MNPRRHLCGRSSRHRARGLTLLEVLVTVAILATFATVVYQGADAMLQRARASQSSSNLRNLAAANLTYQAENGMFCPADNQQNSRRWHGGRSSGDGKFDPTKGYLSPYLGESRSVGICPLFRALVENSSSFEEGTGGYGYNSSYIGGKPGGKYDKSKVRISERFASLGDPSKTVMFTTTAYAREWGLQEYAYCEPPFWDFGSGPSGNRPSPSVHFRAGGKALVAWCDGHVSAEVKNDSPAGENPHGGDAEDLNLGWFGPEDGNGYWNPRRP